MAKTKIVIVGGVAAGASAAAKARRCDEDAEIIMFEKGEDISYATCGLPYYLSGVIPKRKHLLISNGSFFQRRFNVRVNTRHEVVSIDRGTKRVMVMDQASGELAEESYDKLILATGADPVIPPILGVDRAHAFTLKTLEDTDRIHTLLQTESIADAVVIGGGLVGVEAAENLTELGINVSMVEFMPQLLPFLDLEMAEFVRAHAQNKGLDIYLSEKVVSIQGQDGRDLVVTDKARTLPSDLIILAAGVRPNVKLASEAGIVLGETGGIKVNQFMQTSDPHVFAAGDCVESRNVVTDRPALIPMGSAANKEGRAAGGNAVGRKIEVKGFTGTVIVKVFDLAVAKTGLSEREAVQAGMLPVITYVMADHHAGYYPGSKDIHIKTVADRQTGRLLGAQIIGEEGVDKRIDVMATAIFNKMTAEDLIHLDLAYAPPFSSARDPIIVVGNITQNYFTRDWQPITPEKLYVKMMNDEDFILVDMRTRKELMETGVIPGAIHLPIDELRGRLDEFSPAQEIVLYCAVGMRSYLGTRIMNMRGFKNVKTLTGGIESWTYERENFRD